MPPGFRLQEPALVMSFVDEAPESYFKRLKPDLEA
jgi:hypothetical protein